MNFDKKSEGSGEASDEDIQLNAAQRRARLEEQKLDQQEIENNEVIKELENGLKDSNRANLSKKEIQKMEKKLEKAQMQANQLARIREMREQKEAQRLKQEKLDQQRLEEEAEAEAIAQKRRQEKLAHEESEYQRWKSQFTGSVKVSKTMRDRKTLVADISKGFEGQRRIIIEEVALKHNLTSDQVFKIIEQLEKEGKCTGIYSDKQKEYIRFDKSELEQMAQFISDKGRVSVEELSQKIYDITD